MNNTNTKYEIEPTGWGARVNRGGQCLGVVTDLDGAFAACALKPSRVPSLSARGGFRTAPETDCGSDHATLEAAAAAVAEAWGL